MIDINGLYELMFKDIVTPFNLLENARLGNYQYVKYYTKKEYFIAEMKCSLGVQDTRTFYYCFDTDSKLQRIYQKCNNFSKELLFDRSTEIERIKKLSKNNDREVI